MNLSQQVCNLELSKKLKELGVKQKSVFYWMKMLKPDNWQLAIETRIGFTFENGAEAANHRKNEFEMYSAYTVAELGELLPAHVQTYRTSDWWCTYKARGDAPAPHQLEYIKYDAKTEADARALMLIYLLEHKLITL